MGELLSTNIAQGEAAGGGFTMVIMLVAMFAILYFFTIRPQKKQQDEHAALLGSLKKGDDVVLNSGIFCKIHSIAERTVVVEMDKVKVRVLKSHVSALAQNLQAGADLKSDAKGAKELSEGSGEKVENDSKSAKKKKKTA